MPTFRGYDRLMQLSGVDREVPPIPQYISKEELKEGIDDINTKIPEEASDTNQLADKEYVNQKVSTDSATFRQTWNLVSDLSLTTAATHSDIEAALATVITTVDNNDYCYVQTPVSDTRPTTIASVERYKYNGTSWGFEFSLNDLFFEEDYSEFVDLGLPSGTLWADRNVGANAPEESGYFFSWGNVGWHIGGDYDFSQANYEASVGYTLNGNIPVSAAWDMAKANFGSKAKIPTKEQLSELVSNCTTEWVTVNGVNGRRFTSNINGNSIFLPASGYCNGDYVAGVGVNGVYWSGSYKNPTDSYNLGFTQNSIDPADWNKRYLGETVRAII